MIHVYVISIYISSLFNAKSKQWVRGRKNIFTSIEKAINNHENIVWFHCASLGEYEQGKPIIEAYKAKSPTHKILLTFFSPSGYEVRKGAPLADFVFYLPADTKSNAKRFISIVKPIKEDKILGEDVLSTFDDAYAIEMYMEDIEGYGGEKELIAKFGLEIRDEATFIVSRRRWLETVSVDNNLIINSRPNEGDLIYFPRTFEM